MLKKKLGEKSQIIITATDGYFFETWCICGRKIIRSRSSHDFPYILSTTSYTCTGAERRASLSRITQYRATNEAFQGNAIRPHLVHENKGEQSRSLKNRKNQEKERVREREIEKERLSVRRTSLGAPSSPSKGYE